MFGGAFGGAFAGRETKFTGTVLWHVVVVRRAVMMKKILKLLTLKWLWDRYKQRR